RDGVLLYIADAVLRLALGAGAVRRARPRPEPPMLGEDQKLVVEHHAARRRVMVRNRGSRVVEQDFLGHPAEPGKGALEAVEPALLPLVAKRPHMQPTRVAERGDKQERLD